MENNSSSLTITEAVERYMAVAGVDSAMARTQYLVRGKEIWRDIRNNVLRTPSVSWVSVDKTKLPYRVQLPKCADYFIGVGFINSCEEFKMYTQRNNMFSTEEQDPSPACSCPNVSECTKTCGIETEAVDGGDKITKTTICANGDIIKEVTQPFLKMPQRVQYEFDVVMQIVIGGPDITLYDDNAASSTTIGDDTRADVHYYVGMYKSDNTPLWGNTSIGTQFRSIFTINDVGVSGFSNGGVNEIGGFNANTQQAYDQWKAKLVLHTKNKLFLSGVPCDVSIEENGVVVNANAKFRYAKLKILAAQDADIAKLMLLSNTDKEFNFSQGDTIGGWLYSSIKAPYNTNVLHQYLSTETTIDEYEVVTQKEFLCKLDTKECGCIELSQKSLAVISDCCPDDIVEVCNSCYNSFDQPDQDDQILNKGGYFKYVEPERQVFLYGDVPAKVAVIYRTNGEAEADEVIPYFCINCFIMGMDYMNSRYSKTMDRFQKKQFQGEYNTAKTELERFLPRNILNIEEWGEQTIMTIFKW